MQNRSNRPYSCSSPAPGLIYFLFFLFFITACESPENEELSYPAETARLISHATSGVIPVDGKVRVRFVSPVIHENHVGQTIKAPIFSFDPAIDGIARWQDRQTLLFEPSTELPMRQEYNGTLDLQALLPEHEGSKDLVPLEMAFQTSGREVFSVEADFKLAQANDPKRLHLAGKLVFTTPIALSQVVDAISLRKGGRKYKLNWQGPDQSTEFGFESTELQRGSQDDTFELYLEKEALEISNDYRREYTLAALTEMRAMHLKVNSSGQTPGVEITFSDQLDRQQDLDGLISAEPAVDLKYTITGTRVLLSGAFSFGERYTIKLSRGIRSRWATATLDAKAEVVQFEDLNPQLRFSSSGVFLTTSNNQRIRFQTLNLSHVRLEIKQVYENNLGQFLQTEQLSSNTDRNDAFNNYYINRVGVVVVEDTLEVGEDRNQWKQHELDLASILDRQEHGLFLLRLSFTHDDMLYGDPAEMKERSQRNYWGDDYYSNPYSNGYIYAHGNIYKPLIASDIGLTYKRAHGKHLVYATQLVTGNPLTGVTVRLKSYQNQILGTATTDGNGIARLQAPESEVFYVEGEKGEQRSVVKLNEMAWNLSTFDTEGADLVPDGLRAFIYTERGVYRPGDLVNLSAIIRNAQNSFPENHPVILRIFNPRNQKVHEQTNRQAKDGFYSFGYQTNPDDPTGNWRAELEAGSGKFYHTLKIETVVPYRLKVNLEPEKRVLTASDRQLNLSIRSTYLFGNPASGLQAEVDLRLRNRDLKFDRYKEFSFSNKSIEYQPVEQKIFAEALSEEGTGQVSWTIPASGVAPSALRAELTAKVFEKGGRPNINRTSVLLHPHEIYIGLKKPDLKWGYARLGTTLDVAAIAVNSDGEPIAGRPLKYRIYKGLRYWWWEFNSRNSYYARFKSHESTELVSEGIISSGAIPTNVQFEPEERGIYFLEVQDGESGHTAGFFIRASAWGDAADGNDAGVLALKTDKASYQVGETATVSFPAPSDGTYFVSLEKGREILQSYWHEGSLVDGEMKLKVKLTEAMVPTSYVTVSIMQPHEQTANDRPIRMYGVVPLKIENADTRLDFTISMEEQLASNERFTVDVQTTDSKAAQFTIAVVDEGLLDITQFKTPEPWSHFFRKLRLGVSTYDIFSHVIDANKGDVFNVFSIGGDVPGAYRDSQLKDTKKKRFKPVALFEGPIETDGNGHAKITFEMPNYIGSVRVMVVGARAGTYGHTEKTVPVKTPLIVMPSLPRVISPGDEVVIPVTVFALEENIGNTSVDIEVEGPLSIVDSAQASLSFTSPSEQEVFFRIRADEAIGASQVKITAKADAATAFDLTDLTVRAASPRIYDSERKSVEPGGSILMSIPARGLPGSNQATLGLRKRPDMDFGHRLEWLIRYPYGCIEQTISSVFPQLYLKDFLEDAGRLKGAGSQIDANINRGIRRIRRFQLSSGAFAYWPGNTDVSHWGTLYAGHFLLAAKNLGYSVPGDMISNWIRYNRARATSTQDDLHTRVYRVYLLALAGHAQTGAMNLLKENNLKDMNDTQKWLLASAYKVAGAQRAAGEVLRTAGTDVRDYREFARTYGSTMRDKAMILTAMVTMETWDQADNLAQQLSRALSQHDWYSTQSTGFMLLAVGRYLNALEGADGAATRMIGKVKMPNGETVPFDTDNNSLEIELSEGFGKDLTIEVDRSSTLPRLFAVLSWNGVPIRSDVGDENRNLDLRVKWLNDDGMPIRIDQVTQGSTIWGHFRVDNPTSSLHLEEVALLQVLPAGWEVENIRLSGESAPGWASNLALGREEYLDIRDDRVMWFFDMPRFRKRIDFLVKLNAVSVGRFNMPAIVVEVMYDDRYKATKAGGVTEVTAR